MNLSQLRKLLYQMYIVENMSAQQIAEETGKSVSWVKKQLKNLCLLRKDFK